MFRYFRVAVEVEAILLYSDGRTERALTRNVAAGGIGLRFLAPLQREKLWDCTSSSPNVAKRSKPRRKWRGAMLGDAGLRFVVLAAECRSALEAWIGKVLEEREFAFVFSGTRHDLRPVLIPATEPVA